MRLEFYPDSSDLKPSILRHFAVCQVQLTIEGYFKALPIAR